MANDVLAVWGLKKGLSGFMPQDDPIEIMKLQTMSVTCNSKNRRFRPKSAQALPASRGQRLSGNLPTLKQYRST
jgi:hypothetical protein